MGSNVKSDTWMKLDHELDRRIARHLDCTVEVDLTLPGGGPQVIAYILSDELRDNIEFDLDVP